MTQVDLLELVDRCSWLAQLFVSYLIGLGDRSHVIAGSTEAFNAVFTGRSTLLDYLTRFLLPVGLGNMVGGMTLVAALSSEQGEGGEGALGFRRR